jgi:hypothetical protein
VCQVKMTPLYCGSSIDLQNRMNAGLNHFLLPLKPFLMNFMPVSDDSTP